MPYLETDIVSNWMATVSDKDPFARLPKPMLTDLPPPSGRREAHAGFWAGLPDPTVKPAAIEDDQITSLSSPIWQYAMLAVRLKVKTADDIGPTRSLGAVTLTGFPHIDNNVKSAGTNAMAVCRDLTDQAALKATSSALGLEAVFCPLNGPLENKGPFQMNIYPEPGKLVFSITSIDPSIQEATQVEIPTLGIRGRSRSYLEFVEMTADADLSLAKRVIFERERQNQHRSHAAFLGEKFAQQDWYVGEQYAERLFELALYLVTPALMARAEARAAAGTIHDRRQYAAPTL